MPTLPATRELKNWRGGKGAVTVTALFVALASALSLGAAAEQVDPASLSSALTRYNALQSINLPIPDTRELEALANGGIVKVREQKILLDSLGNEQNRIRIVGYRVYELPRLLVWLGALDFDTHHSKRLTEHLVEARDDGTARWYQYLRLPWPVKDRHWVVRSFKDTDLARQSEGFIWQHSWVLDANGQQTAASLLDQESVEGITSKQGRKAVYVPINRGSWTMFALDEQRVLVAAHVTSVLGGWVPDALVARVVSSQLQSMLSNLEQEAASIHRRYDGQSVVLTGHGDPISVPMAKAACAAAQRVATDC